MSQAHRPKALIISARGARSFSPEQQRRLLACLNVRFVPSLGRLPIAKVAQLLKGRSILGLTRRPLAVLGTAEFERLPSLRGLAVHATGTEWIDLGAARARGIRVRGLGGYSTDSVAEHALGCLLALSRRIHLSHDLTRGRAPLGTSLRGVQLRGRRLGIVGYGRIGRRTARLARSLGMRVAFHDPAVRGAGHRSLAQLLAWCDCVLLSASRAWGEAPILGARELGWLRPHALLVNVSRTELLDKKALWAALKAKRLRGAALDDAWPGAHRGLEPGRLLLTGHSAWYSDEAMAAGMEAWCRQLCALGRSLR